MKGSEVISLKADSDENPPNYLEIVYNDQEMNKS